MTPVFVTVRYRTDPACPDTYSAGTDFYRRRTMKIRTILAAAAISMTLFTVAGTAITVRP
jgi:hypothetical protein